MTKPATRRPARTLLMRWEQKEKPDFRRQDAWSLTGYLLRKKKGSLGSAP
jgi:hypothetical protein